MKHTLVQNPAPVCNYEGNYEGNYELGLQWNSRGIKHLDIWVSLRIKAGRQCFLLDYHCIMCPLKIADQG